MGRTVTISFWVAFALAHIYLGFRFYTWLIAPLYAFPIWGVAFILLFLGSAFQIGHNMRKGSLFIRRLLVAFGGHWAGALLPLVLGFVGLDFLRLLFQILGGVLFPPELLFYASLAIVVVVCIILLYGTFCAIWPRLTRYHVQVQKKDSPLSSLKVALVSDVHLGLSIDHRQLQTMCRRIQALNPDLILIAGDLLDSGLPGLHDRKEIQSVFQTLSAPHGVYVCLGNHDVRGGATTQQTIDFFESCGLTVLHDQAVCIKNSYTLIGRADYGFSKTAGAPRASLSELIQKANPTLPILLLDHYFLIL